MGLMKKLTSAIVASSLVFSLVGTAFAAYTPAAGEVAGKRMVDLKMLQGRADGDLALNSEITRAELVTVIVRAFGKEEDAKLLKGSTIFPDIQNHWASGNIAMAVALVEKAGSDPIGMPDGTFAPDAKLTPAQAVAFLMKFVGVKADGTKTWPANYLSVAVDKGLITAEDSTLIAPMLNENATRGLVFYLFDRAFISYQLPTGKTFYTQYVDTKAPELTVDAVVETTIDSKITVTGSVKDFAELYVGSAKVTPAADGKFSAEFALPEIKADPYTITVTALDIAGNKSEKAVKVTRIVGEAKAVTAPASIELAAGATADVAVKVLDEKQQVIAGVEVTGTSDLGTFENGKFTAGEKVGTGTLTLTAGGLTKEVAVTVKAGALAKLVVEPATTTVGIATPVQFTAKGVDAFGNEVAGDLNVAWTKSGGHIDAEGNFVGTTSGTFTVTATAGGVSGTATITVFGAPAKLAAVAVPDLVANGSDTYELAVSVVDVNGGVAGSATNTVTVAVAGAGITVNDAASASVAAVNGVATFKIKAATGVSVANSGLLVVTAPGLTGTNLNYKTVAQSLAGIKLAAEPGLIGVDNNSTSTISVKFYDQKGVAMVAPAGVSVQLKSSDKTIVSFAGAETTTLTGTWTADVKSMNAYGSATISGTVTAGTDAQKAIAVEATTVSAGNVATPAKLAIDTITEKKAGETQTIIVRVLDVNGNQVTNPTYANTVALTSDDAKTTGDYAVTAGTATVGKKIFTKKVSEAGTVTYKATGTWTAPSVTLTETTQTASVIPGAPAQATAAFAATSLSANGAHSTTLTATIKDAEGNVVTAGNYDVTFEKTTNNNATQAFTKTTVQSVNGVASVNVTSGTADNKTDTYTVTVKINSTTSYTPTASVSSFIMGLPSKLDDAAVDASGSLVVGKGLVVTANVKDDRNVVIATDNGRAFTVTAKNAANEVVGTYTGITQNGIAKVTISDLLKTGTYSFVFESTGLVKDDTLSATLTNDAVAGLAVSADIGTIGNDANTTVLVTVKSVDKHGNVANVGAATTVAIANSNPALGTVTGLTDGNIVIANGANNATFTYRAGTGIGTVTFTATASNLTTGSATVNQTYVSALNRLMVEAIDNVTAGNALTFKVTAQDANGVRVTNVAQSVFDGLKFYFDGSTTASAAAVIGTGDRGQVTITLPDTDVAASKAGTHTVKVTQETENLITYTATYTVVPGTASATMATSASRDTIEANGSAVTAVTFKVVDAKGNLVPSVTGTADLTLTGSDYAFLQTNKIDIVGGQGTVLLQAKSVPGNATVSASMKVGDVTYTGSKTIAVGTGSVSGNSVLVGIDGDTVKVVVRDAANNPITGLTAAAFTFFTTAAGNAQLAVTPTIASSADGEYTIDLTSAADVSATAFVKVNGVQAFGTATINVVAPVAP